MDGTMSVLDAAVLVILAIIAMGLRMSAIAARRSEE
jgi:hypothetical protein